MSLGLVSGGATPASAPRPASSSSAPGGPVRRRNLGRLSDLDYDDKKNKSQYNGNSTEQDSWFDKKQPSAI